MRKHHEVDGNSFTPGFAQACLEQCRALAARLSEVKDALVAEFKETYAIQEKLLQLAVNEAEALAWQTEYPHLVFPALALEKVRVAAHWHERQGAIRRPYSSLAFSA